MGWSKARRKNYYIKNQDTLIAQAKKTQQEIRREVIEHYGAWCACCGEDIFEFMTIDHLIPPESGTPEYRRTGNGLYRQLKLDGYPITVQVLCFNCNWCLGNRGFCPHHPEITRPVKTRFRKYT